MSRTCYDLIAKFCAMWEEAAVEVIKLIVDGGASHGPMQPVPGGHSFIGPANVLSLMRLKMVRPT